MTGVPEYWEQSEYARWVRDEVPVSTLQMRMTWDIRLRLHRNLFTPVPDRPWAFHSHRGGSSLM